MPGRSVKFIVRRVVVKLMALMALSAFGFPAFTGNAIALTRGEAVAHCRATVGQPIVRNCMFRAGGSGNLATCRMQAHPRVAACIAMTMRGGMANPSRPTREASQQAQSRQRKQRPPGPPRHNVVTTTPAAVAGPASAAPAAPARLEDAATSKPAYGSRVALVIGNSTYEHVPSLPNTLNDAQEIAAALKAKGFQDVILRTDLKRDQLVSALSEFARRADTADWAIVYYAGHGIEYRGMNYMIPTDARLKLDRDISLEAVEIDKILAAVEGARKLRLIMLDACRDNPFLDQMKRTVAQRSINRGLAPIEAEAGMLIVYSAKHGQVALDGTGQHSPFTTALLDRIRTPNLEIRRLFDLVRDDVLFKTNKRQQPFSYGSLSGSEDFYF